MIKVKNLTNNTEHVLKPTIFPDGTSQVWKLPKDVIYQSSIDKFKITWYFENEAEIFHLLQLKTLLSDRPVDLVIPFFPYSRQDKQVSNDSTFALSVFLETIGKFSWNSVQTVDVHSGIRFIGSLSVDKEIQKALALSIPALVCFPDKGASLRGYTTAFEGCDDSPQPSFNLDKKRNQSTGVIEGLVCPLPLDLKGKTILIVDDICDGGKTFIEAAKLLYGMGAEAVDLYVTHGIFSQGIHVLTELGKIRNIYTTDSILKNVEREESHKNLTVFKLEL